jgi:hypothetical protein
MCCVLLMERASAIRGTLTTTLAVAALDLLLTHRPNPYARSPYNRSCELVP